MGTITRVFRTLFATLYLLLVVLTVPLAFDVGGSECGLGFTFTICALYFLLTTLQLVTRRNKYVKWISLIYYGQHLLIPSLLTFFLSYYKSNKPDFMVIRWWKFFIVNSTPIFTILEGFCSLLLIQAIGQTLNWLTVYKSDSWLIVSLVGSGCILSAALYLLYRIFVFPFTIDIVSATLLGSLLTITVGLGLFGIISRKGSMIESSLLFAYIVRCIYETFPALSESASTALTSFFTQATKNLRQEIPFLPPQVMNKLSQSVPFLASNLPGSFKTIWEFLFMSLKKVPLPLLLNFAYRIGVFYAATKIIPSLYHGVIYPSSSPPRTPPSPRSDKAEPSYPIYREPPSTLIKLIYAYAPCIVIGVYTHLMMSYSGKLSTESRIWVLWNAPTSQMLIHPWQLWNWINMASTILLYTAELMGNVDQPGGTALTSHWTVE